jgi:beta-ureidopropionase / N-carbamoyl-L-amino-acid hydrolase
MDFRALAEEIEALMPVASQLFAELQAQTSDGVGITRASYGAGEQKAWNIVADAARGLGFEVSSDAAANLLIRMPGSNPAGHGVITGSHLDSVPVGGNFDGAAGVIGGLIALAALREVGPANDHDITVMGIRGEETAWFSVHHIGSRAALGLLPASEIETATRFDTGRTLAEHMSDAGCDLDRLRCGEATWNRQAIKAFFELHIEQGPVLVHEEIPVAIVTGIRGNLRARQAKCSGTYAHSGAVPRNLRHDAVLAGAELAYRAEAEWDKLLRDGRDMVLTLGKFHTNGEVHSHNKVPGELTFSIDVRSDEQSTLDHMENFLTELAREIGERRGIRIDLGELKRTKPAVMAPQLCRLLRQGADRTGVSVIDLASGGGHDAGDFANAGVRSAMVFVRNPNGSHNPDEAMTIEDFCEATKVLAAGISLEANS